MVLAVRPEKCELTSWSNREEEEGHLALGPPCQEPSGTQPGPDSSHPATRPTPLEQSTSNQAWLSLPHSRLLLVGEDTCRNRCTGSEKHFTKEKPLGPSLPGEIRNTGKHWISCVVTRAVEMSARHVWAFLWLSCVQPGSVSKSASPWEESSQGLQVRVSLRARHGLRSPAPCWPPPKDHGFLATFTQACGFYKSPCVCSEPSCHLSGEVS